MMQSYCKFLLQEIFPSRVTTHMATNNKKSQPFFVSLNFISTNMISQIRLFCTVEIGNLVAQR